jgi:DoxX-like protein
VLIARLILDALLVLLLLGTGGGKLLQVTSSLAIRDSLQLSNRLWRTIGTLEILAVVGVIVGIWVPVIGLLASAGVAALMIGAIIVRARAGQRSPSPYVADVVVLVIALASTVLHALAA